MREDFMSARKITELLVSGNPPDYIRWNRERIATCIHFLHRQLPLAGQETLDLGHDVHVGALLAQLGCRMTGNVAPDHLGGHEKARVCHTFTSVTGESFQWPIDAFDFEQPFPYEARRFALVTAMEVIEHINSTPKRFLSEIRRVLKPGGHLFIGTPNAACWTKIARQFSHAPTYDAKPYSQDFGPRHPMCHVYEYTPWELQELLRVEGFKVVAMKTWDPYELDPRGLRKEILRMLVAISLGVTLHIKQAALLYRHRGHQIGLLAQIT